VNSHAGSAARKLSTDRRGYDDRLEERQPPGRRPSFLEQRQFAETSLMFSKRAGFRARVEITNGGLLSIAALVSTILLTTTVLVHVAVRDGKGSRRSLL
jgi:hypothetical protein